MYLGDFNNDLEDAINSLGNVPATLVISSTTLETGKDILIPEKIRVMFLGTGNTQGTLNIGAGYKVIFESPKQVIAPPNMTIRTGDGKIAFNSGGDVHMEWWGEHVPPTLQDAIDSLDGAVGGGTVLLPLMDMKMNLNEGSPTVYLRSHVHLRGVGKNTILSLRQDFPQNGALLTLENIENVTIEGVYFLGGNAHFGKLEITATPGYVCKNITVKNCWFASGYAGIWLRPKHGDSVVEHVHILNNDMSGIAHSLNLGGGGEMDFERIQYVNIIGNTIHASGDAGSDCIKLRKRISNVIIKKNVLRGAYTTEGPASGDGIDMFASGDRVIIESNTIEGNGVQGIDIKTDDINYPPSTWGSNRHIVIKNNIIRNNYGNGIKVVARGTTNTEWPEYVLVSNNEIYENGHWGILCGGRQISLLGNLIHDNAKSNTYLYGGIQVEGNPTLDPPTISEHIIVSKNIIFDNKNEGYSCFGIEVKKNVRNVQLLDNIIPNQVSEKKHTVGITVAHEVRGAILKGNQVEDQITNVNVYDGAQVQGEMATCNIGNIATGSSGFEELALFVAPTNLFLVSATFVNGASITPHDEDLEIKLYNNPTSKDVFFLNLSEGLAPFTSYPMNRPQLATKTLEKGNVLIFRKPKNNHTLEEARIILNYVTY